MAFDGVQCFQQQVSERALTDSVFTVPGSEKSDTIFWLAVMKNRYNAMICIGKDVCVLIEQGLNSDGRAERTLFAPNDERHIVYGIDPAGKEWKEIMMNSLPVVITEEKLLAAAEDGKLGMKPRAWRDLTVDGERLDLNLSE